MKSDKYDLSLRWEGHEQADVPVKVPIRSYLRFCRWMDGELHGVVARWSHAAAPGALRPPRFRFRIAKPK